MTYPTISNRLQAFSVDRCTAMLIAVQVGFAALLLTVLEKIQSFSFEVSQSSDVQIGVGLVALIVAESIVIIGIYRLYRRLSEMWQRVIRWAFIAAILLHIWTFYYLLFGAVWTAVAFAVSIGGFLTSRYGWFADFYWAAHNTIAAGLGLVAATILALVAAPPVVIVALVALLLWDYVAVFKSRFMGDLVDFSASLYLPNYLILPGKLRVDYGRVRSGVQNGDLSASDDVLMVLGLGDVIFPSALVGSAYIAQESVIPALLALCGVIIALAHLRRYSQQQDGGVPALPWVNTGAIAGFVVGIGVVIA